MSRTPLLRLACPLLVFTLGPVLGPPADAATGSGKGASPAKVAPAPSPGATVFSVNHVLTPLQADLAKTVGPARALALVCELRAAGAHGGKAVIAQAGSVEDINDALGRIGHATDMGGVRQMVNAGFPRAFVDDKKKLWRKLDGGYVPSWSVTAWAVDDVQGTLYAADPQHRLFFFDDKNGKWRSAGAEGVYDIQASGDTLFYMQESGALFKKGAGLPTPLMGRPTKGTLLATQGVLYVLSGGKLYRYARDEWDKHGEAIRGNVKSVAAHGGDYFTLDDTGLIYSSADAHTLEHNVKYSGIYLIGPNLLATTAAGGLRGYDPVKHAWKTFGSAK